MLTWFVSLGLASGAGALIGLDLWQIVILAFAFHLFIERSGVFSNEN